MRIFLRSLAALLLVLLLTLGALAAPPAPDAASNTFTVPVVYYKLPNGLRVALSPDHSAPTVRRGAIARNDPCRRGV